MAVTKIADLIDAEVMADIISAKIPSKIAVSPFAKVDTTLTTQGAGDTITVPKYDYIGDAEDVEEGATASTSKLTATSTRVTVKKAMKAVSLTDEAMLSGYGDPAGQATTQLSKSIASKVDVDCMEALQGATLTYAGGTAYISYNAIVSAIDVFEEELNSDKVIFINPAQVGALRKDANFLAADKIAETLLVTGAIGKIANCEVVPTSKVPLNEAGTMYSCPIVKLNGDTETEDETAALTIFMKRNVNVETERDTLARTTVISADEIYAAALTDASKVVLASFKK
jgi:N4-gp56 family major capsid protein